MYRCGLPSPSIEVNGSWSRSSGTSSKRPSSTAIHDLSRICRPRTSMSTCGVQSVSKVASENVNKWTEREGLSVSVQSVSLVGWSWWMKIFWSVIGSLEMVGTEVVLGSCEAVGCESMLVSNFVDNHSKAGLWSS